MRKHFFVLFGTRPEAIKLFPIVKRLRVEKTADVTICVSGQHRELLDQVLKLTEIIPDIDLDVMQPDHSLDQLSARLLTEVGAALDRTTPNWVIVQGDTTTAMVGALAAYYRRIPVAHVEAGLRTGDKYAPWPEEVNRKIITSIADQHFAPTTLAAEVLEREAIPSDRIHVTGNTAIDALLHIKALVDSNPELANTCSKLRQRQADRRIILVTTHRRENFGTGIASIAEALLEILKRSDVAIILPIHLNPNVREVLRSRLAGHPQAEIIEPQDYAEFVALLSLAEIVLTDSGGIQEEAPSLGKPVLVMRDTTERPEGVIAGTARLVGTDPARIVEETFRLLDEPEHYSTMSRAHNPFGDGYASDRIVKVLLDA